MRVYTTLVVCSLVIATAAAALPVGGRTGPDFHRIGRMPGDDPADSWLAYTISPGNGKLLTYMNATWTVPSNPNELVSGNAPGWWFGIEPVPAADLIQPILAWGYPDPSYTIFNGYYQWDDGNWWYSDQGDVQPGNTIYASVSYVPANDSYTMIIGCIETGWSVMSSIAVETGKKYTDAYFVMEHQPDDCGELPNDGQITFTEINIELENKPVTPKWQAFQYQPACNSQAQVLSPRSVKFTWDTSQPKDQ